MARKARNVAIMSSPPARGPWYSVSVAAARERGKCKLASLGNFLSIPVQTSNYCYTSVYWHCHKHNTLVTCVHSKWITNALSLSLSLSLSLYIYIYRERERERERERDLTPARVWHTSLRRLGNATMILYAWGHQSRIFYLFFIYFSYSRFGENCFNSVVLFNTVYQIVNQAK